MLIILNIRKKKKKKKKKLIILLAFVSRPGFRVCDFLVSTPLLHWTPPLLHRPPPPQPLFFTEITFITPWIPLHHPLRPRHPAPHHHHHLHQRFSNLILQQAEVASQPKNKFELLFIYFFSLFDLEFIVLLLMYLFT